MRKIFISLLTIVVLAVSVGCGNEAAGETAQSQIIPEGKYNCAVIKAASTAGYRRLWTSTKTHTGTAYDGYAESNAGSWDYAAFYVITSYTIHPQGYISITTKDGVSFLCSAENVILIYDETITE